MYYGADLAGQLPAGSVVRGQNSEGRKACRSAGQQPTKFEFVINLKTAKQIGVTISPDVLARATKIIR